MGQDGQVPSGADPPTALAAAQYFGIDNVSASPLPGSSAFPLTITPATSPATGYDLEWASQAGMLYDVLSTGDLSEDLVDWDLVAEGLPATPDENTLNVTPVDSSLYYRVREYPPPPMAVFDEDFEDTLAGSLPVGWTSGTNP